MSSSSGFVPPYYSPGPYYTTVHELGSDPIPSRSPSPAIEDEIELLEPDEHDRDCFYARAVYRTWRAWKPPASSDPGTPWDGNKCPLKSCDSRFKDISSMLTHVEAECEALRSKVDKACSQARSTQTRAPVTTVSQAVEGLGESQPRCSKCHSTWCRTKSLFENNKSLKRFRSLHDSFIGRRKRTPPPDTTGKVVHGTRTIEPVEVVHGPRALEPVEAPAWEGWELGDESWELEGRPVSPPAIPPVELPASSPLLSDSRPSPTCGIRSTPSKSFTGVSDMSETTASTYGRDSLISVYSRPTVSSSSTTLSLPPICTTTKPLDSQGPIYAESLTLSPIDTEDGDISSEVSSSSGPRGDTPAMVAGRISPEHIIRPTFASSPKCPSSVLPEVFSLSSEVNQQESYLPSQSIPIATVWHPDPTPTDTNSVSPEATASLDEVFVSKLECLKLTLSNLLKPENNHAANQFWAGRIPRLPDESVLLGALDTFEKLLMGVEEEFTGYKFCFAYLALAMAVEIGQGVPETYHTSLRDDFKRFVDADGGVGLTWRFLDVAGFYLKGLNTHNSTPGRGLNETDEEGTKRMHDNFRVVKDYLHKKPSPRRPSASRQDSYSSTASTLVNDDADIQVPPRIRSPSRTTSYDSTLSTSVDKGEETSPRSRVQANARKRHRDEPAEISCPRCGFYPDAPGQQKKLTRHYATRKHNRLTGDLRISREPAALVTAPPVTTPPRRREDGVVVCPHLMADGSPCQSKFTKYTRKDNFKNHLEKKHPEVNPESMMRGKRGRYEAYDYLPGRVMG